ncbi:MAG: hypothetical protein M1840_007921 [Geoglossum simile]|nr:MAG: hypothetical protein M1840_007921 [Geoglossum simile]
MSTTPPTSPPLPMVGEVQKPAEKRSHEQMNEPALNPDVQTAERPEVLEIIPQPSRSASPSKQGRILPKKSIKPETPPAGHSRNAPQQKQQQQQQQGNMQEETPFPRCSDDSMHMDSHPKNPIEPFDWDNFEERFCNSMTEIEAREDKLYEELTELTRVR